MVGGQRTLSNSPEGGVAGRTVETTEVVCGGRGRLEIQSGPQNGMSRVPQQEQLRWGWGRGREASMALWVWEENLKMRGHCQGMRLMEGDGAQVPS